MRKAIQTASILALESLAEAKGVKHPFVGEHSNAGSVHRENGTASMRLNSKYGSFNKHSEFISGEGLLETDIGYLGSVSE